jgi:hypothetical protein
MERWKVSNIEKKISATLSADEIASSALSQLVGKVEAAIAQNDADTVKARETAPNWRA